MSISVLPGRQRGERPHSGEGAARIKEGIMTERTPVDATNIDGYGNPDIPWSEVRDQLATPMGEIETISFLGTVRPDGRPHAAGVGPCWFDGDFYLACSRESQKIKNLAVNPNATLAIHLPGFDVTLEGTVSQVDDPETIARVAELYRAGGWPAESTGDALTAPYSAPSAGPPPWHLFRFHFSKIVALRSTEPGGAMRWRFDG
jgi:hypothetical protein